MLAMATAARRWNAPECPGGHGELIWGSWEPWIRCSVHYQWQVQADERSSHPGVGNYAWMVTVACARKILVEVARALVARNLFPMGKLAPFNLSFSDTYIEYNILPPCVP